MKYLRLVSAFTATPWAMKIETLEALSGIIERAYAAERLSQDQISAAIAAKPARTGAAADGQRQNVAVIGVHGVIAHRASMIDDVSSGAGCSAESLDAVIRSAAADPSVRSIVLDIDSPGGSVYGIGELSNTIMQVRAQKPIAAVANSCAASAAYWIGTAAHELFVIPSGEVGSIGVFAAHTDFSGADRAAGRVTTLISAGRFKTEGNSYQPLGADAKAHMQSRVDDYYTAFVKDIARQRGKPVDTVRQGFGQGRTVGAQAALSAGMVDGVATLSEVIGRYARRTLETANKQTAQSSIAAVNFAIQHAAFGAGDSNGLALAKAKIAIAKAAL